MYVPIIKYPWGGSFCPEAFAEAKLTGSGYGAAKSTPV